MPLKLARFIHNVALVSQGDTSDPFGRYVALMIVALLFIFDLVMGSYFYVVLRSTALPVYVLVTGGAIVSWAFTSLGINAGGTVSNSTTQANTQATKLNTTAMQANTTATESGPPPPPQPPIGV
jgi:hypothetical protein